MTIVNANDLPDGTRLEADICIIGAGAAGITIATELNNCASQVILLESGSRAPEESSQTLNQVDNVGYPIRENFMSRVRQFGGGCTLWAGRSMKLNAIDFARRDWITESGWPISGTELQRFSAGAERVLKLPRFDRFEDWNSLKDIEERERQLFQADTLEPRVALWAPKPLRFNRVYRKLLQRSPNIRTYLDASVTEIQTSNAGNQVTEVAVATLAGKRFTAKAKVFILACGALENARLLLVSRGQHANGLGNQYDIVGRYYQDHPRVLFGQVRLKVPTRLPYLLGLPLPQGKVQLGVGLSEQLQRREELLNCYVSLEPQLSEFAEQQYGRTVNVLKVVMRRGHAGSRLKVNATMDDVRDLVYLLTPKEIMPHFLYRYYAMLKRQFRKAVSASHLTVINFCEQTPDPESRVYLTEDRDALGMQKLALDWRVGENETRSLRYLHKALGEQLEVSGIGSLETSFDNAEPGSFTDASHHSGTTRMSSNPATGVVDADCKVHGLCNLYVAGSSVFPTCGHANPTYTIVCLALRLADHLKRQQYHAGQ